MLCTLTTKSVKKKSSENSKTRSFSRAIAGASERDGVCSVGVAVPYWTQHGICWNIYGEKLTAGCDAFSFSRITCIWIFEENLWFLFNKHLMATREQKQVPASKTRTTFKWIVNKKWNFSCTAIYKQETFKGKKQFPDICLRKVALLFNFCFRLLNFYGARLLIRFEWISNVDVALSLSGCLDGTYVFDWK